MQNHLIIIGVFLIALAFIHVVFPKYFNWKQELSSLSLINRQMMVIHTLFIALLVFLMGLLCLTSNSDIAGTSFGRKISLGLAVFWTIRLGTQIFGYSSKLWKGKTFETTVHVLFIFLWAYFSLIFWGIALGEV